MARRFELGDDALVVHYEGLSALAVLARELRVPYAAIRKVSLGLAVLPPVLAWRLGVNGGPFSDHRMGRFWIGGKRLFFDVAHRERAVVVDLTGVDFDRVVIEPDHDPEGLVERLRNLQSTSTRTMPSTTETGNASTGS